MILVDSEKVIIIFDSYKEKENGRLINGVIYPMGDVIEVDVPDYVIPQKYCYNETDGFYLNPNYKEPVNVETEVVELRERVVLMQQALDDLILGGAL